MDNILCCYTTDMCISNNNKNIIQTIKYQENTVREFIDHNQFPYLYLIWYDKFIESENKMRKEALGFCKIDNIRDIINFCKNNNFKHKLIGDDVSKYTLAYSIDIKDSNFIVLDFDEYDINYQDIIDEYSWLQNCCYTRGTRGNGFHFYCYSDDKSKFTKNNDVFIKYKVDIIVDKIWEDCNNIFYNSTTFYTIDLIDKDFIRSIFNSNYYKKLYQFEPLLTAEFKGNSDELEEIVNNIPQKYSNDYNDWIKIISILKIYNKYDLAKSFSQKSKKYTPDGFDDFYYNKTFKSLKDGLSIKTIYYYSKDNKTNYDKIIKKYQKQISKKLNTESYEAVEKEFNLHHFLVINKKCFIRLVGDDFVHYKPSEFKEVYRHKYYDGVDDEGNVIHKSFINQYLDANPNMRTYDDIDVYPNPDDCPVNHYNIWKPFAVSKIDTYEEDIDGLNIILNHIKILCNYQEEVYEYLLDWLAHMFQIPEEKIGIFVLLVSKQGAGKGMFTTLIKQMIGEQKYLETSQPDRDVWGDFNPAMCEAYFVNIEELDFLQQKGNEGKFKSMTTQLTMPIHKKGKDLFQITSYHRYMGSTNCETLPMKTSPDDRRNLIIKCSDDKRGDSEYFNILKTKINSKNLQKTFYDFLMKRPNIELFRSKPFPKTQYQEDLKDSQEDPLFGFLREYVVMNHEDLLKNQVIKSSTLYQGFLSYIKKEGLKWEITHKSFGMKMINLNFTGFSKLLIRNIAYYSFNIDQICTDLKINIEQ